MELKKLSGAMARGRKLCKNKTYINKNSMNRLFLIVYIIALMFPIYGSTLDTESNKISCSDLITCTKCTTEPMCVWSIKQQSCKNYENEGFNSSNLIVHINKECPKFSIVKKYQYAKDNINVNYIVRITNDLVGFINYLKSSDIYCNMPYFILHKPVTIINKTNILCSFKLSTKSQTFFWFIDINGIILRFENVADNYDTVSGQEKCATYEMYKSCATCGWNKNSYSNYLKWCSSENTCNQNNNIYMKNIAIYQIRENVAYVTNNCAEINVTAVDPLSGPETGGTTVAITVRNHRILAENRTVMVTVAGTVCVNPRTSGPETITCTTSRFNKTLSGPILVEYSSIKNVLKIESSQIFHFCFNPVLDTDQQLEGIASGGTSVPVHGDHFVESCFAFSARLYVDLADGIRRYAFSYCDPPVNNTYMICRSPSVNGTDWNGNAEVVGRFLNFGLYIKFINDGCSVNETLPISIGSPSFRYYVRPDPVLLDFEIDKSGSLVVTGLHLHRVQPKDIVVRSLNSPSSICVVVSVTRHSLVCKPTMPAVTASQEISVTFGNSLVFTVIGRHSTHNDDPSAFSGRFFVIMSTVLLFVGVFTIIYRDRNKIAGPRHHTSL